MTREDKELLLKDLCARLPYGVKIRVEYPFMEEKDWYPEDLHGLDLRRDLIVDTSIRTEEIKPYLFPLSSMSKEQEQEEYEICKYYIPGYESNLIDFYNKNHFDYRGLIEKGLAIDATGLNIY